jgi:type IV secretion system protein VirB8
MSHNDMPDGVQRQLSALRALIEDHEDIQNLLDAAADAADSKVEAEQRARLNAWRVTCGAVALTVAAFAVAGAAILTSMQPAPPPQILVIERATGKVEPLVSLSAWQVTPEDASIKRLAATYLRARENYSFDTAEDNYRDAAAFMDAAQRAQWVSLWDTTNPRSPVNTYKKDGKVHIDIGAMTIMRNSVGVATGVRASFTKIIKRNDRLAAPITGWIATIPFRWTNVPTSERDRRVNDLGFAPTDYLVDADLSNLAAATATVPSAAPPALALSVPSKVAP